MEIFKTRVRTSLHVPKVARCEFCRALGACLADVVSDTSHPFHHWKRLLMLPAAVFLPKSELQIANDSLYGKMIKEQCCKWCTTPQDNIIM